MNPLIILGAVIVLLVLLVLYYFRDRMGKHVAKPVSTFVAKVNPSDDSPLTLSLDKSVKYEWKLPSSATDLCAPGDPKVTRSAFAIGVITQIDDKIHVKWNRIQVSDNNIPSTDIAGNKCCFERKDLDTAWNAKYLGDGTTEAKYQSGLKNIFTFAEADQFLARTMEFSTCP